MKTIRLSAFRVDKNMGNFLKSCDVLSQNSKIGQPVKIQLTTEKEIVTEEYLRGLEKHIEKMRINNYRYEDVKVISVE